MASRCPDQWRTRLLQHYRFENLQRLQYSVFTSIWKRKRLWNDRRRLRQHRRSHGRQPNVWGRYPGVRLFRIPDLGNFGARFQLDRSHEAADLDEQLDERWDVEQQLVRDSYDTRRSGRKRTRRRGSESRPLFGNDFLHTTHFFDLLGGLFGDFSQRWKRYDWDVRCDRYGNDSHL